MREKQIGSYVDCDGSPQCLSLRIEHCLFGGLSSSGTSGTQSRPFCESSIALARLKLSL